ncbi:MAG: isocitrate lyase/phosphoenolpyruvate mutase family protein [Acidimicrobiia bacterium]|nr:isocitrate lyase/phosphoenolpyruvate mutase family protein [Acidimicrobiia bacterium]
MTAPSGRTFRQLHEPGNPFVLANAWDLGSARVLEALGAEAIGTSSAAHAFTLGLPDMGHVSREQALDHAVAVASGVTVPVSGDLENGYGHAGTDVAETVRLAGAAGLAGCSIEDTALPDSRPYPMPDAVARIEAAVTAARALPNDFVLVARADGVMKGHYGVDEAIARIRAFESVGADCVYVPLPPTMADLARICESVDVPVNALVAGPFVGYSRADFAEIGVARLSLGSALARVTHRTLIDVSRRVLADEGDFAVLGEGIPGSEVDALLVAIPPKG